MVSVTKDRLGLGTGGVFTSVTVTTTPVRLPHNLIGRTLVEIYNESSTDILLVGNESGTVGRKVLQDVPVIIECSDSFASTTTEPSLYMKTASGSATVIISEYK